MKRVILLLLSTLLLLGSSFARKDRKKTVVRDTIFIVDTVYFGIEEIQRLRSDSLYSGTWETIRDDSMYVLESFNVNLDSLLNDWHARKFLVYDSTCVGGENPVFSDSVYMERLANMPTIVPMVYNQPVRSVIDRYAVRHRALVSYMLGIMQYYAPIIEQALDYYHVPNELKYLPVIESAFNPKAVSRVGATGLWQFMFTTGKLYGLNQNSLVDDRIDPVKSTWAAAHYLSDLYSIFGDWTLAIAAYNCGPGNINKAIRRSGGKTDFWDIYWALPRETRGYVPAFIAANYIMTYYEDHGICPMESALPLATDTLMLNQNIYLKQISEVCDVDMETLCALNPQYKEQIIPGGFSSSSLRLPMDKIPVFLDMGDSVYNYRRAEFFPPQKMVEVNPVKTSKGYTVHKIRPGETLGSISRKYHVSVAQLKKWNGLKSDRIQAGRTLKIY
jgi:membrane-bound lytic murein transglycosylase D